MGINYTFNKYRDLIVGVGKKVPLSNGERVVGINFDNAATTPPFDHVLYDIVKFSQLYSSTHRGTGYKSQITSKFYDGARDEVLKFVNADPETHLVIFVKNTTEGINKLSYRLMSEKKSVVLSTWMEHHSNDLPWRDKYQVEYADIDAKGMLSIKDLEDKLYKFNGEIKLVTVSGASNVTGYVNDIHAIARLAHKYNARLLVDGAQLVPHARVNMRPDNKEEWIDFLVFSAHKMYAPFGTGVIIAPKACFIEGVPEYSGGGTVQIVTRDYVVWENAPYKEEAGSPNILGVRALISSIHELNKIGMVNVEKREKQLTTYAINKLMKIPRIKIYCDTNEDVTRVGIIPFNIEGIPHYEVSRLLSENAGIAVRNGCFCAQPYVQRLMNVSIDDMEVYKYNKEMPRPGMVRVSFGIYNTYNEVDILIKELKRIVKTYPVDLYV